MVPSITTIAVLGAGTMGRGLAQVAAAAGFRTHLYVAGAAILQKAEAAIHRNLAKGVELGKVDAATAERARGGLRLDTDLSAAVAAAELVIEAIPEEMRLKIDTFHAVAR